MAMFENFPYTDMHNLNLDWIIKIAKDFLDQYTHIQQLISDGETSLQQLTTDGLQQLQDKADTLEGLLDDWYNTHSSDIADQLADAIQDLNDWYIQHQGYLNQYLQDSIHAFNTAAEEKASETIESIPSDYTTVANNALLALSNIATLFDSLPEDILIRNKVFNPTMIIGEVAYKETGEIRTGFTNNWARTDYIRVPSNAVKIITNMYLPSNLDGRFCFYDANLNCISASIYTTPITIPSDSKYVILTDYSANSDHTNKYIEFIYSDNVITFDENAYYKHRVGQIANTSDFDNIGFLNNSGQFLTGSGYSVYSYSDPISVNIGDTIKWTHTGNMLNTQLGGYFNNGEWVANLGEVTPINGIYTLTLDDSIIYDSIILNVYTGSGASEFEVYANCIYKYNTTGLYELDKNLYIPNYESRWTGKTWVALGDSWTEGAYVEYEGRYTDSVSRALQMNCINLGVGGTGIEKFAEQDNKPLTPEIANSADLITIWGSINNMAMNGANCGTLNDAPSSTGTLMSMWKYTIEKVLALNPRAQIVIIGCPVAFHSSWAGYGEYNSNHDTIENSVQMIGKLANHYGIPFVNMFELSGFNSYNFNHGYFDRDKIHPNAKGVARISNILIQQLNLLQPIY